MKYLAKSEPARAKKPLFLFLLVGLVCFFAARITSYMRWVFDIGTIVCMSGIGYFLLRYVYSSFEYELTGEALLVYRLLGRKQNLVFSVQREMIKKIEKYNGSDLNNSKKKPLIYPFSPSYGMQSVWVLTVQTLEVRGAWIYLQCGEEFAGHIQKWIEKQE